MFRVAFFNVCFKDRHVFATTIRDPQALMFVYIEDVPQVILLCGYN